MKTLLQNPHSLFAQWLRAPWYWQRFADLCLFGLFLVIPLWQWHGLLERQTKLEQETTQMTEELQQQTKRHNALKQQHEKQRPTPQLAGLVLPINQQITSFKKALEVEDLRWEFHATPRLHLALLGRFKLLQHFLETLLKAQQSLQVESIKLQKDENGVAIRAEIIFRLMKGNHEN